MMTKKPFFILFLLYSFTINAQVKTGMSLGGGICTTCVNERTLLNGFTKVCQDRIVDPVLGLPRRVNYDNKEVAISFYMKADLLDFYNIIAVGVGANAGYALNYFKRVNYINTPHPPAILNTGSLYNHCFTNDIFITYKLLGWVYLETGLHSRYLIYRKFPFGYDRFKNTENEKKYGIPKFYNKFYVSIGIEIKDFVLKFRGMRLKKNIAVETLSEVYDNEREPTVTKFYSVSQLSLSIPLKKIESSKVPLIKL